MITMTFFLCPLSLDEKLQLELQIGHVPSHAVDEMHSLCLPIP